MSDAEIIAMPIRGSRPLSNTEGQLLSRALESYAYRARNEGRKLDDADSRDEAHAFYRMADQAQDLLNRVSWMRVMS